MVNLEATFREVLQEPLIKPKIRHRREISPDDQTIVEEETLKSLVAHWNVRIVQSALDAAREKLSASEPDGPAGRGRIRITRNNGKGHIPDQDHVKQKPDMHIYQEGWFGDEIPNIVAGEIKPASKWKSDWIHSDNASRRKDARDTFRQVVKYLVLAKTRYGFVLTDEELVAVRISKCVNDRTADSDRRKINKYMKKNVRDSALFGLIESQSFGSSSNPTEQSEGSPSEGYEETADSVRLVDRVLEYRSIPWAASGKDCLTVNLVLWWLPMLAVQGNLIQGYEEYTSLGEKTRGQTPVFQEPEAEMPKSVESADELALSPMKRKRDGPGAVEQGQRTRSKRHKSLSKYVTGNATCSTRAGSRDPYPRTRVASAATTSSTTPSKGPGRTSATSSFNSPSSNRLQVRI